MNKEKAMVQAAERRQKTKQKVEVLHEFNKQKKQLSEMRREYLTLVLTHPDFQMAIESLKEPLLVGSVHVECLRRISALKQTSGTVQTRHWA